MTKLYFAQPLVRAASSDFKHLQNLPSRYTIDTPGGSLAGAIQYYTIEAYARKRDRDAACGMTAHPDIKYVPVAAVLPEELNEIGCGYRTRRGSTFGVGSVHKILTNTCYATGLWPYGKRDSRNGGQNDPSTVVEIPVPAIIDLAIFERVQTKLSQNNPRTTAPRIVNGPSLLTGLAVCASCGSGMTRTGTSRRGKSYSYYSCAGCQQRGKTVCKGRHIPAAVLDDMIVSNLKERLFTPDRLATLLQGLVDRQATKSKAVDDRLRSLETEVQDTEDRLRRLYRSIEDGVIELDDLLRERAVVLKSERERAKAALDRARSQGGATISIDAEKIDVFARLMTEKLEAGDVNGRKAYIRAVVSAIEVDDKIIRIIGCKDTLQAAIAGKQTANENVRGFVRKWRTR